MNNSAGKKAEIKKFSSETCIAYTELMYKLIGKRVSKKKVEKFTDESGKQMSLDKICDAASDKGILNLDAAILSRIQKGKAETQKNPYLLTNKTLKSLLKLFDIEEYELVWGNEDEQELFIKMLLLAILCNGTECPIPCIVKDDGTIVDKFDKNDVPNYRIRRLNGKLNPFYQTLNDFYLFTNHTEKDAYSKRMLEARNFFTQNEYYQLYELLNVQYDPELQDLSDALFRLMLDNFEFTKVFTEKATNTAINRPIISALKNNSDDKDMYNEEADKIKEMHNRRKIKLKESLKELEQKLAAMSAQNNTEASQQISDFIQFIKDSIKDIDNDISNISTLEIESTIAFSKRCQTMSEQLRNLEDLLYHPSKYIPDAMDYKETDVEYFMDAFCCMWNDYKLYFMKFFKKNLFQEKLYQENLSKNQSDKVVGLKKFSNKNIENVIKSKELLEFTRHLHNDISIYNPEFLLANTYFSQKIYTTIILQYSLFFGDKNYSSIYKSMNESLSKIEYAALILLNSLKVDRSEIVHVLK